jgi:hypothetical protein
LSAHEWNDTVLAMYQVGRMLQFVGLVIPLLAIIAQLTEAISAGELLKFAVVAACLFGAGYLLQQYSGRGRA